MTRLTCYRTLEELASLREAWTRLVDGYPAGSTCMSWEWAWSWWRAYGAGRRLLVFAGYDGARLIGLAPMATAGRWLRRLEFLGRGSVDSDHLDAPVLPGYREPFARDWTRALAGERWDWCRLDLMPAQSWVPEVLPPWLRARGWWHFDRRDPTCAVPLPASWTEYLQGLRPSQRHHLERYGARLRRRYRVRFECCLHSDQVEPCLQILFSLHGRRWRRQGQTGIFADANRRHFYRCLTPLLLERARLQLWLLYLDDRPAAAQYAFRHQDRIFQLQEGFDPDFAADRVGTVLRAHVLERLIEAGVRHYDYLGGHSPEKGRWGGCNGWYRGLEFASPFSRGGLYLLGRALWTLLRG